MSRLASLALLAGVSLAAGSSAGEFDGLFKQGPGADCEQIGVDGGALKIEDDVFHGIRSNCRMENPVSIRDMNAELYDMTCDGEKSAWVGRALFMHAADDGLIMVWDGFAFKYDRCPEKAAPGPLATDATIAPVMEETGPAGNEPELQPAAASE